MVTLRSVGCSLIMSFSLFSKVPVPQIDWEAGNMRYVMCSFPLVGAVEGGLLAGWCLLAAWLGLGELGVGVGLTLIPVAYTGGIHLDGFCDVVDALSSHSEPESKRTILKDPHVGAFAVIGVAGYLLLYVAIASELVPALANGPELALVCLSPVLSRCLSGIATLAFPKSLGGGMLSTFSESADTRHALSVLFGMFMACAISMVALDVLRGAVMVAISLMCLVVLWSISTHEFGGMSGDLAGWFLELTELAALCGLMVISRLLSMGVIV